MGRFLGYTLKDMEESVEGFIAQFKPYAATVEVLSKTEGSPLLEIVVVQKVLHLLERTAPYGSKPGKAQIILNPMTNTLEKSPENIKTITVPGVSKMHVQGVVLEFYAQTAIVDAGVPLVVTLLEDIPHDIALGDYIQFDSLRPVHGFVLQKEEQRSYRRGRETDSEL
jgi:hypothetical protein